MALSARVLVVDRPLIAHSPALRATLRDAERVAPTGLPVLIQGETGTGKELFARVVHEHSGRAGRFVPVDCGALAPGLVEGELFGHVRGAFTDATHDRDGLVARARGGTLFLDEVGELPLADQTRLLRLTQDGTYRPLGADRTVHADVRFVAATHRDLEDLTRRGAFRRDLLYRLAAVRLELDPLRDRPEDIDPLIEHFLATEADRLGLTPRRPTAALRAHLRRLPWPGNVRELRNVCAWLAAVPRHDVIDLTDLPDRLRHAPSPPTDVPVLRDDLAPPLHLDLPYIQARRRWLDAFQERYVDALLARHNGNLSAAAAAAQIDRRTLQRIRSRRHQDDRS